MTNVLYDKCKESFLQAEINLLTDSISVILVDATYESDFQNDEFKSSISSGSIVSGPLTLGNKTTASGVFNADDVVFVNVAGATAVAIIVYQNTGTDATSRLIAYLDSGYNLPVTPNLGDIFIFWDNGSNHIFSL